MIFRKDICPECGAGVDAATSPEDASAQPSQGDFSVCFYCGAILDFDESLLLRVPSKDVLGSLPSEEMAYLNKISAYMKSRRKPMKDRRVLNTVA